MSGRFPDYARTRIGTLFETATESTWRPSLGYLSNLVANIPSWVAAPRVAARADRDTARPAVSRTAGRIVAWLQTAPQDPTFIVSWSPNWRVMGPSSTLKRLEHLAADLVLVSSEITLMRHAAVLVAVLTCLAAPGETLAAFHGLPGLGASDNKKDQVEAISSALRAQQFDRAVELSRSALQNDPNDAQLWTLHGIALSNKGQTKAALTAFQQALKRSPDYIAALEGAAQLYYQTGSRRAVPLLNRLLRLRPADPTSHAMLAVLEYREGNCQNAVGHFEQAGALVDSQLDALHAHATCLVRLKQLDGAVRVFQRSVTLQPDDPRERRLLAAVQLMAGKPQDAIATLTPLLERPGPDAETLSLASAAYEKAGDTPRAVSTLRQAILLDPKNVNLYLDFATIAFAHQSFQAGIEVLNDGIGLHPTAPLYVARGVLYVQLADYDKAEADFDKANELDPSQALSAAAQGLAAAQANDLDRALATIEAQLARKPNDAYSSICRRTFSRRRDQSRARRISTGRWRRRRKRCHYSRRLPPHAECSQNCSYRPGSTTRPSSSAERRWRATRKIRRRCTG